MLCSFTSQVAENTSRISDFAPSEKFVPGGELIPASEIKHEGVLWSMIRKPYNTTPILIRTSSSIVIPNLLEREIIGVVCIEIPVKDCRVVVIKSEVVLGKLAASNHHSNNPACMHIGLDAPHISFLNIVGMNPFAPNSILAVIDPLNVFDMKRNIHVPMTSQSKATLYFWKTNN